MFALSMLQFLFMPIVCFAQPDLTEVDNFLRADGFADSFHAGESVIMSTESCLGSSCDRPYDTKLTVSASAPDQAVITTLGNDGSPIANNTITATEWQSARQNTVRLEMASLAQSGYQVSVTGIRASVFSLEFNGGSQSFATRVVELSAQSSAATISETLEVAPGLGGLGQLVRKKRETAGLGTDTYTVTSIVR